MNTVSLTSAQAIDFLAICGKTVDEALAIQEATDLLAKHQATRSQLSVSKYNSMNDAELRAELAVRTCAFVSPNMTTAQVRAKLEALDAEVAAQPTKPKSTGPKTQRLGVGKRQVELLKEGKTVDETLAIIQEEFPTAKTTKACVAWYKSKIKAGQF